MVQNYPIPISEESLGKEAVDIDNAFEALRTNFAAASFPTTPAPEDGQTFWHNTRKILYVFDGLLSTWLPLAGTMFSKTITNADTPYTHGLADGTIFADMATGAITINLAAAATAFAGYRVTILRSGDAANNLTIDPNGAETINAAATLVIGVEYEGVVLESNGTNWRIVAQHGFIQGGQNVSGTTSIAGDLNVTAGGASGVSQHSLLAVNSWEGLPPDSPAQLTGDQNDYALGTRVWQRLSSDASRTITGFVAPATGAIEEPRLLTNVGSNDIILANENAGSSADNRIITGQAANVTLRSDVAGSAGSIWMLYDDLTARWRLLGNL